MLKGKELLIAAWLGFVLAMPQTEALAQAAAEEEKPVRIIKTYEDEQAERERQLAREKEERDARRARMSHENQCQFKPVMTDEEIERCRAIYKN